VIVTDGEREDGSRTGTIHLDANGSWVMDTVLSYDWVRKDLNDEMMRLDAEATTGSLNITEIEGSIGLGTVAAGIDLTLTTTGDLIDFRTEQEKADGENNIAAGRDATANVQNGIVGTEDEPLKVSVGGEMFVNDRGDVDLVTDDDLTVTVDSEEGVIHVAGKQDVTVNVRGDMVPGGTVTAGGAASVNADGDIIESFIKGDSVSLTADADGDGAGAVGTKDSPIPVDTASGNTGRGTFSASGTEVYVTELSGDLEITNVTSTQGDAVIVAPGSVTDANAGSAVADAAAAQDAASDAQDKADAAQDIADILDSEASALEAAAAQARQDATDARNEADGADAAALAAESAAADADRLAQEAEAAAAQAIANGDEDAAEKQAYAEAERARADAARDEAEKARAEADRLDGIADGKETAARDKETAAEAARIKADSAQQAANDAQAAADIARQAADAAVDTANNTGQTIVTAGDLIIHAGGSVGTNDEPLDTNVGGNLTIGASGDVNIANQGVLNISDLNADGSAAADRDVTLTAGGDLNSDKIITAENAEINTLNGNVGSAEKPLKLSVDTLSGTISGDGQNTGNADITNGRSLEIGDLSADGHLNLTVTGAVTAGDQPSGDANISAGQANITATGNIGTDDKPVVTAVDELSMSGKDIDIHSVTDVTVDKINGKDVDITSDGRVEVGSGNPNIMGDKLNIESFGGIGTEDKPLIVSIAGKVDASTQYEEAYIKNVYKVYVNVSEPLMATLVAKGTNTLNISWTRIIGADGYDIFFVHCNGGSYKLIKTIDGDNVLNWNITGLSKNNAYKAYVKAFIIQNGQKVYVSASPDVHAFTSGGAGKYTNASSVTVKKTTVKIRKGKKYKIKASVKKRKGKKLMASKHAAKLRYKSSNTKVATVTKNGTIKAVGKGTCYIYVYAHNGTRKRIKITVN